MGEEAQSADVGTDENAASDGLSSTGSLEEEEEEEEAIPFRFSVHVASSPLMTDS